jgi:anti-sigma regulatory factor (Ser/Thr protein kinase)/anti-anti-sigma regulatory factor
MSQAVKQNRIVAMPVETGPTSGKSFEHEIDVAINDRPDLILLDCAPLVHVISNHINLLWIANSLCLEKKVEMRLLNPSPSLRRILDLLDLTGAFKFEITDNTVDHRGDKNAVLVTLPQSYSDQVPVEINAIDKAVARFLVFLSDIGVGAAMIQELRIIFYEIATNIRLHSGLNSPDRFTIDIAIDPNQIKMTFTDKGRPFDMTAAASPIDVGQAAKIRKRRGFGIMMIRRLANRLEYRLDENSGNILTVCKKWDH